MDENHSQSTDSRLETSPLVTEVGSRHPSELNVPGGGQPPRRRTSVQQRRLPEFSELVLACRHHLAWTATLGCIVSIAIIVAVWYGTNADYQAKSMVRVKQHQAVVYSSHNNSRADDLSFVQAQRQLALSPMVLQEALADRRVTQELIGQPTKDEAVDWLRSLLEVEVQVGSEVMSIVARHPSAAMAHALSLAVTEAYLHEVQTRAQSDRARREEELDRAARQADRELQKLWEQLNQIARDVGADTSQALTIHDEIQLQAYREYAQQLRAEQLRSNELQELIREEEARIDASSLQPERTLHDLLANHPEIQAARQQLAELDVQLKELSRIAASRESPRVKSLLAEQVYLNQQLTQRIHELTPQLQQQARIGKATADPSNLQKLKRALDSNRTEREFLRSRLEEIDTGTVEQTGENGVQLEICRHAVERQSRLTDSLWQALEELRIEAQADLRVSLIDMADYPLHADYSRRYKAAAVGAGMSWLIVILGIGLFEWQSCRVRHSDDLVLNTSLTIFGADSFLDPQAPHPRSYLFGAFGRPRKAQAALPSGVQEAAARLMLPNPHSKRVPSLLVTSASDDEPRHLAAVDLARVFARFKRRTLLVDCDPSSSQLSKIMLVENLNGMRQIQPPTLEPRSATPGQQLPMTAPIATSEIGLDFFPLGKQTADGDFLDPQLLRLFLLQQRATYDAIVVNGPAMMSSADSLLFAAQVDQTLIAVFEGVSQWNRIAAVEQLAFDTNVPLAGAVLHPGIQQSQLQLDLHTTASPEAVAAEKASDELAETELGLRQELDELRETLRQQTTHPARPASEPQARQLHPSR